MLSWQTSQMHFTESFLGVKINTFNNKSKYYFYISVPPWTASNEWKQLLISVKLISEVIKTELFCNNYKGINCQQLGILVIWMGI